MRLMHKYSHMVSVPGQQDIKVCGYGWKTSCLLASHQLQEHQIRNRLTCTSEGRIKTFLGKHMKDKHLKMFQTSEIYFVKNTPKPLNQIIPEEASRSTASRRRPQISITLQKVHLLLHLWYLCQFFLIDLTFIDNLYEYNVIVRPHSGRKCCAKLHSSLLVSFFYPGESHDWLLFCLTDWSIKVT